MKILGVHSVTHDTGAALCEDGKIRYAAEEERFTRIRHSPGLETCGKPPYSSIRYVLEQSGTDLNDIDAIVHVGWPGDNLARIDPIKKAYREFAKELDSSGNKTIYVDHHMAHAASSFYASGFDSALTVVIDGGGDWLATSLYVTENKKLERVDEYFLDQSLGFMYTRAARVLGLGGFGFGEGKIMALAAYGNPLENFPPIISTRGDRYRLDQDYYERFKNFTVGNGGLEKRHMDFAATVQTELEHAVLHVIDRAYERYGYKNVCIAGGVGLNCTLNGKIRNLPWVAKMFVQPAANDGGLCVGAAYLGAIKGGERVEGFDNIYLGPQINLEIAGELLENWGLKPQM